MEIEQRHGAKLPCWRTWSLKSLSLEKAFPQCSHTNDSVKIQYVQKNQFFYLTIHVELKCKKIKSLPTGSACLCRWSKNLVLLANMLPHVGQATSLSWVWLRMCSLKRYLILKKASQPVTVTVKHYTCLKKERKCSKRCLLSHTIPLAEESLLLLCKRLLLSTLNMIVHMTVEPLRIVEWTLYEGHMWSPQWFCLDPQWHRRTTEKMNTIIRHSAPTGKQIFLILQEQGCCCAVLGCSWANQGGTRATVSQWTLVSHDSCGSRHGPPIQHDYPWTEIHSPSRDKHTHLNNYRGEKADVIKSLKNTPNHCINQELIWVLIATVHKILFRLI